MGAISANQDAHYIMPAHEGDIAGRHEADFKGDMVFGYLIGRNPSLYFTFIKIVFDDILQGILNIFRRKPFVFIVCTVYCCLKAPVAEFFSECCSQFCESVYPVLNEHFRVINFLQQLKKEISLQCYLNYKIKKI